MFNFLIVDDEPIAIEGVKAGVNWEKYNVSDILSAFNMKQAQDILKENHVDIMLCDIEMPQGNGLDLLSWVKDHYPDIYFIIFTCHTDFSFAKKAMQLGSLDYILKPVAYEELEKVIGKAIDKINERQKNIENSQLGECWRKNQSYITEQFWLDIIKGNIHPDRQDIIDMAKSRNIQFSDDIVILPILFNLIDNDTMGSKTFYQGIRSGTDQSTMTDKQENVLINIDVNSILDIISIEKDKAPNMNIYKKLCKEISDNFRENHQMEMSCYIGNACTTYTISHEVQGLREMQSNNVTLKSGVFLASDKVDSNSKIQISTEFLSTLLLNEEYDKYIIETEKCLKKFDEKIDSAFLKQFHQDILQMVYTLLKQKGIQAHQIFSDSITIRYFEKSTRSVYDMMAWIKHIISRIKETRTENSDSLTVIEKVKRYITLHITQNLTRDDIANYVYLNSDYLSRLFKKETGMTLMEYFQNERLNYAKELIEKTDWHISKVAAYMGYSNFSHFARAFKEIMGMSPTEFKIACSKSGNTRKEKYPSE